MQHPPVRGIVLRTYPYRDADLLLRVATDSLGKIGVLARGARKTSKRSMNTPDIFDHGYFTVAVGRGTLHTLTEFNPASSYKTVRYDLDKLILGSLLCETADLLTREGDTVSGSLYHQLTLALTALDEAAELRNALRATYIGLAALLQGAGFFDLEVLAEPSAKNLMALCDEVERHAELRLRSRDSLAEILLRLRKELPANSSPTGSPTAPAPATPLAVTSTPASTPATSSDTSSSATPPADVWSATSGSGAAVVFGPEDES